MNKIFSALTISFVLSFPSSFAQTQSFPVLTDDGHTLSGVLTLPVGTIQGVALILQGSGNVAADGDVTNVMIGTPYHGLPAKLSEQIAAQLAQVGVATLRYSKRGVDDATLLPEQTIPYILKDAETALRLLQTRFADKKIAIVGLSEGALVATLVAGVMPVDALFLMSIPTRSIDEVFGYEFFGWPTEMLIQHFDPLHTGTFAEPVTFDTNTYNLFQAPSWSMVDANHDQQVSVESELLPTYQKYYYSIRTVLNSADLKPWYQSMQAVPEFSTIASKVMSKTNFIYSGKDDPQVRWNWVREDAYAFQVMPTIRLFDHAGHCFAPLDGPFGGVKTSGPLSDAVLNQLGQDVASVMSP